MLHVNYSFCLDTARRHAPSGRVLDYGCGAGNTVKAGFDRGMDIWGTDVFYEAAPHNVTEVHDTGLIGQRIFEMKESRIPFPDAHFDFVFHNQVFEHVPDIGLALSEIRRVLKPGGKMLSIYPSREVLLDGHRMLPFAHWFEPESKAGQLLVQACGMAGIGRWRNGEPLTVWAKDSLQWIKDWCHYRPRKELIAAYQRHGFTFEPNELSYITYRLNYKGHGSLVPIAKVTKPLAQVAFRRVAGMVVISR